jgi:hypothetical protein
MTPESLENLNGITENVRFEIDVWVGGPVVRRLERELPSAEELDRWFATPVKRAA